MLQVAVVKAQVHLPQRKEQNAGCYREPRVPLFCAHLSLWIEMLEMPGGTHLGQSSPYRTNIVAGPAFVVLVISARCPQQ